MNFDITISELLSVDGALAAAVVDYSSGMLLAGAVLQTSIWKSQLRAIQK